MERRFVYQLLLHSILIPYLSLEYGLLIKWSRGFIHQLLFVLEDGFYKSTRYLPSDAQLFLQEMSTQLLGYLSSRGSFFH